ncbi:MAG: Rdx family protein [Thermoanaerobaculia bacterium]
MFNVIVGNDTIYSKHETGVFPNESEIVEKLKKMG